MTKASNLPAQPRRDTFSEFEVMFGVQTASMMARSNFPALQDALKAANVANAWVEQLEQLLLAALMVMPDNPDLMFLPLPVATWERAMRQQTRTWGDTTHALPMRKIMAEIRKILRFNYTVPITPEQRRQLVIDAVCGPGRIGGLVVPTKDYVDGPHLLGNEFLMMTGNETFMCKAKTGKRDGYFVVLAKVDSSDGIEGRASEMFHKRYNSLKRAEQKAVELVRLTEANPFGGYELPKGDSLAYGLDIVNAVLPPSGTYVPWE